MNQLTIAGVNGGKPYVEDAMSVQQYGLCSTILVDSRYEVAENLKGYAEQMLAELKNPYVSYEIGAIDLHRLTGDTFSIPGPARSSASWMKPTASTSARALSAWRKATRRATPEA